MNKKKKYTVLDIFCGAGGFSEGFRQQGFKIRMGLDAWKVANETFNINFGLSCKARSVLDLSIEDIEKLPNTHVILGSPPCVSFSNSNRSGKASKALGLRLTETFLRIVAIKKFRKNSILKAWFMENVPNSLKFIKRRYTFKSLGLSDWAIDHEIDPKAIAILIKGNSVIINAADYGAPQRRNRAITGEIVDKKKLIIPPPTHSFDGSGKLPKWKTLSDVREILPSPFEIRSRKKITDPLFKVKVAMTHLTDHFYDTGLYESEWRTSRFHKQNHPYMGKMSFPENEKKPSRTITAMNIGTSRETMIFKSEVSRNGNGEYRLPTVREMACLMGFPITFQFSGSESSKTRQVGNAVCTSVSSALARTVLDQCGRKKPLSPKVKRTIDSYEISNLNTFTRKAFDSPPFKKKDSRFRKHPFKHGNITVTLSNYNIASNKSRRRWQTSVQYGNGSGYPSSKYPDKFYKKLEHTIKSLERGKRFIEIINNGFSEKIARGGELQVMYEKQKSINGFLEPTRLIEEVARIVKSFKFSEQIYVQGRTMFFEHKKEIPKSQILALYAVNRIATRANEK